MYVLVFMHLETREVFVTPSTRSPDSAWVTNQAKAFVNYATDRDEKPTCLIHDRDTKFSAALLCRAAARIRDDQAQ
ncbi:hypothetical protein [Gimesia panareensis]|uniref:hypothetical protein n=1 Tax=Gimesia panareensis TaxID=2527978 RepID=UPI0011AAAE8B|nr:hypothetical protein [Gimesia panareensis]